MKTVDEAVKTMTLRRLMSNIELDIDNELENGETEFSIDMTIEEYLEYTIKKIADAWWNTDNTKEEERCQMEVRSNSKFGYLEFRK